MDDTSHGAHSPPSIKHGFVICGWLPRISSWIPFPPVRLSFRQSSPLSPCATPFSPLFASVRRRYSLWSICRPQSGEAAFHQKEQQECSLSARRVIHPPLPLQSRQRTRSPRSAQLQHVNSARDSVRAFLVDCRRSKAPAVASARQGRHRFEALNIAHSKGHRLRRLNRVGWFQLNPDLRPGKAA